MSSAEKLAALLRGVQIPWGAGLIVIRFGAETVSVTIVITRTRGERGWAMGCGTHPSRYDLERYKGRGWEERMAADILAEYKRIWGGCEGGR